MTDKNRVSLGRSDYGNIMCACNKDVPATEISMALFEYMLSVLPPITREDARGSYFMSEFLCHTNSGHAVTIQFLECKRYGKHQYFAKYVVLQDPNTFINDYSLVTALPIDHNDAVGYA